MPARPPALALRTTAASGIVLALAATLSGCGASAEVEKAATAASASPTASAPATTPAAADSPAATAPAAPDSPTASSPAATPTVSSPKLTKGKVSVLISGASPAIRLVPGGPARTFTVHVGNGTARTYKAVQVVLSMGPYWGTGGDWIDSRLTLQRLDSATGRWLPDTIIVATDASNLAVPVGGGALKAGALRTVTYRIAAGRGAPLDTRGSTVSVDAVAASRQDRDAEGLGKPLGQGWFDVKVSAKK